MEKRISGFGGVFIKSPDVKRLASWYKTHLGLDIQDWGGVVFKLDELEKVPKSYQNFSLFKEGTDYLLPSKSSFMINFICPDLDSLCSILEQEGIEVLKKEDSDFGKFAWILDPDANKIELWEPNPNNPYFN